jgi:hypothetical protein
VKQVSKPAEREEARRSQPGGAASSSEGGGAPVSDSGGMVAYHCKLALVSDVWWRGEASGKMESYAVVYRRRNEVAGAVGAAELRCGAAVLWWLERAGEKGAEGAFGRVRGVGVSGARCGALTRLAGRAPPTATGARAPRGARALRCGRKTCRPLGGRQGSNPFQQL